MINDHFKRENILNLLFLPGLIAVGILVAFIAPNLIEDRNQIGIIGFGTEAMYFQPCGSKSKWWLESNSLSAIGWNNVQEELDSQPECSLETMPCEHQSAYVELIADISSKGKYGHLGNYERSILVTEVLKTKKAASTECGF